jgi:hypothetical protein
MARAAGSVSVLGDVVEFCAQALTANSDAASASDPISARSNGEPAGLRVVVQLIIFLPPRVVVLRASFSSVREAVKQFA